MQPTNKVRFETFSDSVFAIAVTLLALQLRVPLLETNSISLRQLAPLTPGLLTFVLSFVTIAIFWVNHHQLTQVINLLNHRRVLWLNMLFLLFVTLLPFITETISLNTLSPLAIAMYAFALFAASASFSMLRYWIHKSAGEQHVPLKRSVIGPIIYLLAIIAPLFSITLGYVLLAIPPLFYFLPKGNIKAL
jgi:uncharacterized membrane protein